MAKYQPSKPVPAKYSTPAKSTAPTTVSRNSPLPKQEATSSGPRQISHEMIAKRAYEIYVSGKGGSQHDNWLRAERELKGR
jgi:hypothetical protein